MSTTQAHVLSLHTPSSPGVGSKAQNIFFSEVVNLREWHVEHHANTYSILTSGVGSKGQNFFFLNVVMLHIRLKGE